MNRNEISKLELPLIWTDEEKNAVKEMLFHDDVYLEKIMSKILETFGDVWLEDGRRDMELDGCHIDNDKTLIMSIFGGRNADIQKNGQYYFMQLASLMHVAEARGVYIWPLEVKFDPSDDLYYAKFGVEFCLYPPCHLLFSAKEIGLVKT